MPLITFDKRKVFIIDDGILILSERNAYNHIELIPFRCNVRFPAFGPLGTGFATSISAALSCSGLAARARDRSMEPSNSFCRIFLLRANLIAASRLAQLAASLPLTVPAASPLRSIREAPSTHALR